MEIARSLRNNFRVNGVTDGIGGRATECAGGPTRLPLATKLRMPVSESVAVRLWGISFIVERETTQNSN